MVAAGRSFMSWLSSFLTFSSTFGALPGLYLGASSPTGHPSVALDRGEAYVEEAGSLSLWHATLYSSDYLVAQVSVSRSEEI